MTRRSISHVLFYCLVVVVLFCLFTVFQYSKHTSSIRIPTTEASVLADGWYVINENISQEVSLPYKFSKEESNVILYHSNDQVFLDTEFMYIFAPRQHIELYFDGIQVFRSNMVLPFHLEEISSFYHIIPLPKNRSAETVKLLVRPYSDKYREVVYPPFIGNFSEFIGILLQKNIGNLIFGSIVFVGGLLFLFLFFLLRKDLKGNHTLSSLSLFSFLIALWIIFDSSVIQFLFPNPTLCILIKFLSFLFISPTILIFFINLIKNDSKIIQILFYASLINIAVVLILQITGLSNLQDSLFTTHLVLLIICLSVVLYLSGCTTQKKQELEKFYLPFYCLIIGTVVEIVLYYLNDYAGSVLIQFFVTLFILLFGRSLTLDTLAYIQESRRAEYYKNLAYYGYGYGIFQPDSISFFY